MDKCVKCAKAVKIYTIHQCQDCATRLCRECDDRSDFLRWWETPSGKDIYICNECQGRREGREGREGQIAKNTIELVITEIQGKN